MKVLTTSQAVLETESLIEGELAVKEAVVWQVRTISEAGLEVETFRETLLERDHYPSITDT